VMGKMSDVEEMLKKEDYSKYFRHSEYPFRDSWYNSLVKMHEKRGKPWTTEGWFSDRVFWSSFLDQAWPWIPMLVFLYVFYWMTGWIYDHYGTARTVIFVAVMMLFRVNALIRQVTFTNKILKKNFGE
jgi:hypothetical protein